MKGFIAILLFTAPQLTTASCTKKATIAPLIHLGSTLTQSQIEDDQAIARDGFKFFEGDTSHFDRNTTVIRLGLVFTDQDREIPINEARLTGQWEGQSSEKPLTIQLRKSHETTMVVDRMQMESRRQIILTIEAKGYETIIKTISLPKQATRRIVTLPVRMKNLLQPLPNQHQERNVPYEALSDEAKVKKRSSRSQSQKI